MNSNAKFTGFSPEELAAQQEYAVDAAKPGLDITESDNIACDSQSPKIGEYDDFLTIKDVVEMVKSPDNGQTEKPVKKHKKKKMSLAGIIAESQKLPELQTIYYDKSVMETLKKTTSWAVPPGQYDPNTGHVGELVINPLTGKPAKYQPSNAFDPASEYHYDTIKQDDIIGSPSEAFPDQNPLSKADIQKANEALKAQQAAQQAQVNAQLDFINYSMTAPVSTAYSTYIMGKDAAFSNDWGSPSYMNNQYKKEITWLQSQMEEAKNIIKQLSGEPSEFIYIHPFDLYELINSFTIPAILDINKETKDHGYIEINGKKYKQSTLIPAKTDTFKEEVNKLKSGHYGVPPPEYDAMNDKTWNK